MQGRVDVFIHSGPVGSTAASDEDSNSGVLFCQSSDCISPFAVQLVSVSIKVDEDEEVLPRRYIEVIVSLHLALGELCDSKKMIVNFPTSITRDRRGNIVIPLSDKVIFDIVTRDLPRATRLMFRVYLKKKRNDKLVSSNWTAVPLYDFKGSLASYVDLNLFEGNNSVPVNTTLSNNNSKNRPGNVSAILGVDPKAVGVTVTRIMYSSPLRTTAIQVDSEDLSPGEVDQLKRILCISFDPLSVQRLTEADKEFIWNLRYNIINRSELLPAFVMCIKWNDSERVQELYDLLDIWSPPSPLEALQLLDRRFMDPKVRAYAVHRIEELRDDELSLYMLQLVQQLKFENYVDSALSRLLLRRSLKNKRVIGHIFFWLLQSEVYNLDVRPRFTALL